MDVHLGVQWQGVLIACLAGVGLAAVYDGLRIFRLLLSGEKGHVVLQDFFFMVFSAFITFLVCLAASYGRIRLYLLACEGIGAGVYFLTLGQVTQRMAKGIHRVFCVICSWIRRFLFHPVFLVLRAVGRGIRRKLRVLKKIPKKSRQNPQNPLKPPAQIVYNHSIGFFQRKRKRGGKEGGPEDEGH